MADAYGRFNCFGEDGHIARFDGEGFELFDGCGRVFCLTVRHELVEHLEHCDLCRAGIGVIFAACLRKQAAGAAVKRRLSVVERFFGLQCLVIRVGFRLRCDGAARIVEAVGDVLAVNAVFGKAERCAEAFQRERVRRLRTVDGEKILLDGLDKAEAFQRVVDFHRRPAERFACRLGELGGFVVVLLPCFNAFEVCRNDGVAAVVDVEDGAERGADPTEGVDSRAEKLTSAVCAAHAAGDEVERIHDFRQKLIHAVTGEIVEGILVIVEFFFDQPGGQGRQDAEFTRLSYREEFSVADIDAVGVILLVGRQARIGLFGFFIVRVKACACEGFQRAEDDRRKGEVRETLGRRFHARLSCLSVESG